MQILERRLAASIDQVGGFLDYAAGGSGDAPAAASTSSPSSSPAVGAAAGAGGKATVAGAAAAAAAASGGGKAASSSASSALGQQAHDPVVDSLLRWDASLKDVCAAVGAVADAIGKKHPHLLPQ